MSSFLRIFSLEWRALWRGKTLAIVSALSLGWVALARVFVRGDGTVEGAREMLLRFSLSGAAAIVAVSMLVAAAGSLAKERDAKMLQLSLVRPVWPWTLAIGRIMAISAAAAAMLFAAMALHLAVNGTLESGCFHVFRPVLPSPEEEARIIYDFYMNDPNTPVEVKKAPKDVVLRLLAQRAKDNYLTIPAGDSATIKFAAQDREGGAVRLRFTNLYDQRRKVEGEIAFGEAKSEIGNITQAVNVFPLEGRLSGEELKIANNSKDSIMLRPRRDIALLVPADGFVANYFRAFLQLCALMTLMIAFGVALSSFLSRPVAIFTVIVALIVSEMSPSVIEQYPDELETDKIDKIGLVFTRFAAKAAHPVSAMNPLGALAENEAVEWEALLRSLVAAVVFAPVLLALVPALALPRKQPS